MKFRFALSAGALAALLLLPSPGEAFPLEKFHAANALYDQGNFSGAIAGYEGLLSSGTQDYRAYYNLANAYYRDKKIGYAFLNLLRAQRLAPRDDDIRTNLAFLKQQALDKFPQLPDPVGSLWRPLALNELAWLFSLFYFLTIGSFAAWRFRVYPVRVFRWGAVTFGLVALIFLGLLYGKYQSDYAQDHGVVIAQQVEVKSGPGEDFLTQFTGHEGLTLTVLQMRPDWYEALFPNGVKGWVKKETVELL